MITHWDIFMEFVFDSMRFNRGTFLKGELAPSSRPFPFFDGWVLFFLTTATHLFPCSNKRSRWLIHTQSRGSCSSLRFLRNVSSTSPESWCSFTFSIANGIPIDAKIVPRPLLSCVLFIWFIWTSEPVWRAFRIIPASVLRIEGVYMQSTDWLYSAELKSLLLARQRYFLMLMLKFFQRLQHPSVTYLRISVLPVD